MDVVWVKKILASWELTTYIEHIPYQPAALKTTFRTSQQCWDMGLSVLLEGFCFVFFFSDVFLASIFITKKNKHKNYKKLRVIPTMTCRVRVVTVRFY